MTLYKIVLIGFGNVGQAFLRLLLQKQEILLNEYGISYTVTGIATGHHGIAINQHGIDPLAALELAARHDSITSLSSQLTPMDTTRLIRSCGADVLFENSPVNYDSGQPALNHIRTALEAGMHAITANKGPVVHGYPELSRLANDHGRKFYFESAVMDGAPIFSLFRGSLPALDLKAFYGILNSTTNLVLTRMEAGDSFERAVAYAQSIGLAETDPSGDIDGWDAAVKVSALVTVLMGIQLKPGDVDRSGIRLLTIKDIQQAQAQGKRWKLVCSVRREGGSVKAMVKPELVGPESPLYGVSGTSSIVTFVTDVLPQLSIVEGNPGPETTAYGLLADFINVMR